MHMHIHMHIHMHMHIHIHMHMYSPTHPLTYPPTYLPTHSPLLLLSLQDFRDILNAIPYLHPYFFVPITSFIVTDFAALTPTKHLSILLLLLHFLQHSHPISTSFLCITYLLLSMSSVLSSLMHYISFTLSSLLLPFQAPVHRLSISFFLSFLLLRTLTDAKPISYLVRSVAWFDSRLYLYAYVYLFC